MPTRAQQLKALPTDTLMAALVQAMAGNFGTCREQALFTTGTTVDGDKFSLGNLTYEFMQVNTDTTADVDGALSATALTVPTKTNAHGVGRGDIIRIDNEYMLVTGRTGTAVNSDLTVTRAYAGSTGATHNDNAAIYKVASNRQPASGVLAVPVGATLTAAATQPLLVAAVNWWSTQGYNKVRAMSGATTTVILSRPFGEDGFGVAVAALDTGVDDTTEAFTTKMPHAINIGDYVKLESEIVLVTAVATRKAFTATRAQLGTTAAAHLTTTPIVEVRSWNSEASTNHTVEPFFHGGGDAVGAKRAVLCRAITAAEATAGVIIQPLDYAAIGVVARVLDASANFLEVTGAGKEVTTYAAPSGAVLGYVTVTEGSTAWAEGDTLLLEVFHAVPTAPQVS